MADAEFLRWLLRNEPRRFGRDRRLVVDLEGHRGIRGEPGAEAELGVFRRVREDFAQRLARAGADREADPAAF